MQQGPGFTTHYTLKLSISLGRTAQCASTVCRVACVRRTCGRFCQRSTSQPLSTCPKLTHLTTSPGYHLINLCIYECLCGCNYITSFIGFFQLIFLLLFFVVCVCVRGEVYARATKPLNKKTH